MNTRTASLALLLTIGCVPWARLDIDTFLPPADGAVDAASVSDAPPVEASADSGEVLRADVPGADVVVLADQGIVWITDAPDAPAADAGTVPDAAREDAPVVPVDAQVAATDAPLTCGPLEAVCGGVCVALLFDPAHCGRCGEVCPTDEHGEAVCRGGRCEVACAAGYADCGRGCQRVSDDPANCGACGRVCGESAVCDDGACVGCAATERVCGSACVTPATDNTHCGECGVACHGGRSCVAGVCSFVPCGSTVGQVACGVQCMNIYTDRLNCGECGRACAAGQSCSWGDCVGG